MKKIYTVSSVVMFISAGLLMSFTIWAYANCKDIVAQAKAAGQLAAKGSGYDIVSFYMGNCGQYFVFSLLLVAAGLLLLKKPLLTKKAKMNNSAESKPNAESDAELDDWFDEIEADKSK
jgi:hypothetical protein